MTALFEYLHKIQSVWIDNLEYQVKEGWLWLDPLLTLVRDYFFGYFTLWPKKGT